MKYLLNITVLLSILFFTSCNKDDEDDKNDDDNKQESTSLKVMFEPVFDGMDNSFELNKDYLTEMNDTVNFSKLAFFISNVKITKSDGTILEEEDSYHLVEKVKDVKMSSFTISDLPKGIYTKVEFSIGVDPVANSSIDQVVGDLEPTKNPSMLWSWDTGYKFLTIEGTYRSRNHNIKHLQEKSGEDHGHGSVTEKSTSGSLVYHIGSDVNYKTLSFNLPDVNLSTDSENEVHFMVDASQVFKNPTMIDIEDYAVVMGGDKATVIANNYEKSFIMLHHAK